MGPRRSHSRERPPADFESSVTDSSPARSYVYDQNGPYGVSLEATSIEGHVAGEQEKPRSSALNFTNIFGIKENSAWRTNFIGVGTDPNGTLFDLRFLSPTEKWCSISRTCLFSPGKSSSGPSDLSSGSPTSTDRSSNPGYFSETERTSDCSHRGATSPFICPASFRWPEFSLPLSRESA